MIGLHTTVSCTQPDCAECAHARALLSRLKNVSRVSNSDLEALATELEGHNCDDADDCLDCWLQRCVEREQDARDLWDNDDARVRESVGNYR